MRARIKLLKVQKSKYCDIQELSDTFSGLQQWMELLSGGHFNLKSPSGWEWGEKESLKQSPKHVLRAKWPPCECGH